MPSYAMLLVYQFKFPLTCLRHLSENRIEALPDKIFEGVKNLKGLWVQLITYETIS